VSSVLNAIPATAGAVNSTYITDAAVTQAKLAANVSGNGPAFSAYASSSATITTATWTKVTLDVEDFDTNSNFLSSRFFPTVAGYYQISGCVRLNGSAALTQAGSAIYKNGSAVRTSLQAAAAATFNFWDSQVGGLVYLNGSTDYVELYAYNQCLSNPTYNNGSSITYMTGTLVRSA
jgi:hypothetical protein